VYIGRSEPTAACTNASGAEGGADGHALPHDNAVLAAIVCDVFVVIVVVPLNAVTVVPDVTPVPDIKHPTHGGLAAALAVKVIVVVDPLPRPDPCDVKSPMLPWSMRTSVGPLPRSATTPAFMFNGTCTTVCARAAENGINATSNAARNLVSFI
jgi:hypothetical protein